MPSAETDSAAGRESETPVSQSGVGRSPRRRRIAFQIEREAVRSAPASLGRAQASRAVWVMSPSIGVNLRVTAHCHQGGRKYMEDVFSVAYQQTDDEQDLEFAFFGIFDGHGGREAALFAKDHLMDAITKQKQFWSEDDDSVLAAIREGFLSTQQAMWSDQVHWKRTASGMPSTAGTTASVCFIKRGKLFIGHCGDSGIVMGQQDPTHAARWRAQRLTTDHKPESAEELSRIEKAGGKVINKSGVPRVVWYRPRGGHQGPVGGSTPIDEVPFLAVARALGDLWSYNAQDDVFVVSPDPDLHVIELDSLRDRCLVLATDGAWNVLSPEMAVQGVMEAERNNERHMINPLAGHNWVNPSKKLVDISLERWGRCNLRADNTSIVTVMLDPPGPPRAQVLRRLHGLPSSQSTGSLVSTASESSAEEAPALPPKPAKGVAIISRCPNSKLDGEKHGTNLVGNQRLTSPDPPPVPPVSILQRKKLFNNSMRLGASTTNSSRVVQESFRNKIRLQAKTGEERPPPSTTTTLSNAQHPSDAPSAGEVKPLSKRVRGEVIQCNEVTSSENEQSPSPPPLPERNLKHKFVHLKPSDSELQPAADLAACRQILVKQPRRSIVPEETMMSHNSDSENVPINHHTPTAKLRPHCTRGTPTKRPLAQQNHHSRRSDTALPRALKSLVDADEDAVDPNKPRVLRSAQKGGPSRVTRSSGQFAKSSPEVVALKRKRPSLEAKSPVALAARPRRQHTQSCHTEGAQGPTTLLEAKKAKILRNK